MILLAGAIHSSVIAHLAAALVAANFNERVMVINDVTPIEQFQPPAQEIELTLKNFTNDLILHGDSAMLLELGATVVVQSERSSPQIETKGQNANYYMNTIKAPDPPWEYYFIF